MKAHYTKFETEEQFKELDVRAIQLHEGTIIGYWTLDNTFGFDREIEGFMSYEFNDETVISDYYQSATYLPYPEYIQYLDKCIENAKK